MAWATGCDDLEPGASIKVLKADTDGGNVHEDHDIVAAERAAETGVDALEGKLEQALAQSGFSDA